MPGMRLLLGVFLGVAPACVCDVLVASSELTLRTTSSVDLQVCVEGVLSDTRAGLATAIGAQLQFDLDQTTAVYLTRTYATASGSACFLYVYQAPSPAVASQAESTIAGVEGAPGTLTVNYGGTRWTCALAMAPWQGEDAPLPIWSAPASVVVEWTLAMGGVLAVCLFSACCFVLLARVRDAQRIQRVLKADRHALKQLLPK